MKTTGAAGGPDKIGLVFYRDSASSGGSLRIGETLANGLARAGHDVHLLFAYGGRGPVSESPMLSSHFIGSSGPTDWEHWQSARKLLKSLRPDILHFVDPVIWLQAAAVGLGIPKVLHMHRTLLPEFVGLAHRLVWRAVAPTADAVVFISSGARDAYVRGHYGPSRRTHIVRNAIDVEFHTQLMDRAESRKLFHLPIGARVLLMVGALRREKGCFDAISLLQWLPSEWVLLFCGDGPDEAPLRHRASFEGARVVFAGSVDDIRPAYAAADVVLCLSHYESFGLFMCQAMAAGVPVFGLRGEGEYEEADYPLITRTNAMLLPRRNRQLTNGASDERDLKALSERLCEFAAYPDKWGSMTRAASDWVSERFGQARYVNEMSVIYRSIRPAGAHNASVKALVESR
jgi:glycosyltransferase involved in cell wall biosynthesis